MAFHPTKGSVDHYTRTSLGNLKKIDRGRFAFKVHLTEPDGRDNPFTYFWSAYVKKAAEDNRYERVYYPLHAEEAPVELIIALMLSAIKVANRILVAQVGSYCYVSEVTIEDYKGSNSKVDEWMDKLAPKLQAATEGAAKAIGSGAKAIGNAMGGGSSRRSS